MAWVGGLIAAAGSLAGSGLSARSGRDINQRNLQIAREQMAFQERMSNTAYSRAAADMENAGLNRILALGNAASTPSGASATMQNPIPSDVGDRAVSSALQGRLAKQSLKLMKSQTQKETDDARLKRAQEWLSQQDALLRQEQMNQIHDSRKLLQAQTWYQNLEAELKDMDADVYRKHKWLKEVEIMYKQGDISYKLFTTLQEIAGAQDRSRHRGTDLPAVERR